MTSGSVVIPAYNEEERVPRAVRAVRDYFARRGEAGEVIVVDDGSADRTAALAEEAGARVIRVSPNRGKGNAVRTGMLAAAGDPVLFSDADLSAPIEAWDLLRERHGAGAPVAIGVRTRESVTVRQPLRRVLLGKVGLGVTRLLLLPGARDTQCGFKSFTRDAARAIFPRQTIERFGFDVELLVIARRLGLRTDEVPVPWADDPRTRVRAVRDAYRTFRDVLAIRWKAWRGVYDGPGPAAPASPEASAR